MSKKQKIGLQNRLEIIIQALLDYQAEGGELVFGMEQNGFHVTISHVVEWDDSQFMVVDPPSEPLF